MDNVKTIAIFTGRAMRADLKSRDTNLPKSDRTFHAGRREAYLQAIAIACDCEVAEIRKGVLGSDSKAKPSEMQIPDDVKLRTGDVLPGASFTLFSDYPNDRM
jgi:hypothetical protein